MGDNAVSADNQQATSIGISRESSETTRQTPFGRKEIIAYLNGALHDASRNKGTRIRFVQKYPEWLLLLQRLLKTVGYNSWMYREGKSRNVYALETTCKALNFFFDISQLITVQEKLMYLRGFFDAEGGVPRTSDRFYIQLVQKDHHKIECLKKLLADLGIGSGKIHNPSKRVDPDYWRIFVSTKDHRMFAMKVGSWHPVKQRILRERMKI